MFASAAASRGDRSPTLSEMSSSSSVVSLPAPTSEVQRHRCDHCPQHYTRKDKLIQHVEKDHGDSCPHHCLLCRAAFVNHKRLTNHALTCNGAPPLPVQSPVAAQPTIVPSPSSLQVACVGDPLDSLPGVDGFLESQNRSKQTTTKVRYLLTSASTILGQPPAALSDIIREEVVNSIFSFLQESGRKAECLYQYALVLRKVMDHLAERQTIVTRQVHLAKEFPAWRMVNQLCRLTNKKRKCDLRDRTAGINQSMTPKIMTEDELVKLKDGCFAVMREYEARSLTTPLSRSEVNWYTACLICALLLMGMAPRQQVLQVLTPSRLLPPKTGPNVSETMYEIRVSAHDSKDGRPVLVFLHEDLTPHLDWYIRTVLPPGHQGQLFRQRGDAARADFTPVTKAVTKVIIGREITCHAFRHSIATAFGGAPDDIRRNAARTMNHSFDVHENVYTQRNKRMRDQSELQQFMWARQRQ
jgi:hypothetical protein